MALPIIYKGSDEFIQITLQDSDSIAILPSTQSEIVVSVYQNKNVIIQQWKKTDGEVITVSDLNGIVKVYLDRDNTINLPSKRLYLEVVLEEVNANFESGTKRTIQSDIALCDLKDSV